jgi:mercuric ion binding protein
MTMRTFWVLFLAVPLMAEFRQVEIKVSGLECVSCAESLPKTIERMRGVESATMDPKAGVVLVKLKAGNKLPLEDLRDKLKQAGYTPGDAKVSVVGTMVLEEGKWRFRPAGVNHVYLAELPASVKPTVDQAVDVEGTISADVLKVSAMRKVAP